VHHDLCHFAWICFPPSTTTIQKGNNKKQQFYILLTTHMHGDGILLVARSRFAPHDGAVLSMYILVLLVEHRSVQS
jgi:hypothetical protein